MPKVDLKSPHVDFCLKQVCKLAEARTRRNLYALDNLATLFIHHVRRFPRGEEENTKLILRAFIDNVKKQLRNAHDLSM